MNLYIPAAKALNIDLHFATISQNPAHHKDDSLIVLPPIPHSAAELLSKKFDSPYSIFTESPHYLKFMHRIQTDPLYQGYYDNRLILSSSRLSQKMVFEQFNIPQPDWHTTKDPTLNAGKMPFSPPYIASIDQIPPTFPPMQCSTFKALAKTARSMRKASLDPHIIIEQCIPGLTLMLQTSWSDGEPECTLVTKIQNQKYSLSTCLNPRHISYLSSYLKKIGEELGITNGMTTINLVITSHDKIFTTDFYPCAADQGEILAKYQTLLKFNPALMRLANLLTPQPQR